MVPLSPFSLLGFLVFRLLWAFLDSSVWYTGVDLALRVRQGQAMLKTHLTACCMNRSGSTAENVVSAVPAGTPSSRRISLWLEGK